MDRIVIDASMAASWCFKGESTDYTEAVLDAVTNVADAIAPRIWAYEIRNSVLFGVRRKRITLGDADAFLKLLPTLTSSFSIPFLTTKFSSSLTDTD